MKKIVVTFTDISLKDAGSKAVIDINEILRRKGFDIWNIKANFNSKLSKVNYLLNRLPRKFSVRNLSAVDEVIIQYPLSSILNKKIIKEVRKNSNAKIILIIHDLEALRVNSKNTKRKKREIKLLNSCDGLIVHNVFMKNWLIQHKVSKPMAVIGLFDYLNPQVVDDNFKYDGTVCFAGNIEKSKFLRKIRLTKHELDLYGVTKDKRFPKSVIYKGSHSPDQLPKYLTQNFGLVWDGNSVNTCDGIYGEYMRFNNPHKVSLYISSGIPVIIWDEAALAQIIRQYHLGITIKSLNNLDQILDNVTPEEYANMKKNTILFAHRLRCGANTIACVNKVENLLKL